MPHKPEFYMEYALKLAEKGRFTVSPNPMVGCVIVKDNKIIGEGFHQCAGEPHAEIFALKDAGENAENADVYVTLEPCCHDGRTPPCTEALIKTGVKRVFIACLDPNPLVAGKGIKALNKAGIETIIGKKEQEARTLNKIFFHFIQYKRPFVILKWAMSLDGKTITHPNDSRIISDESCHQHAHEIRHSVDAILIGSKTAILDNPQLTARHYAITHNISNARQPLRIILSSSGNVPLDLAIFSPKLPGKTIIAITEATNKKWIEEAQHKNITLWILQANAKNQVDIPALLDKLGENQITSLLVEGGEEVRNAFFDQDNRHFINEVHTYISPVFIGNLEKKINLSQLNYHTHYQSLGESLCLVASLKP